MNHLTCRGYLLISFYVFSISPLAVLKLVLLCHFDPQTFKLDV